MNREITVKLDEVVYVFEVIEKMQKFFHQPMNYPNIDAFSKDIYPEIKEAYYNIVWEWLPDDVRTELEER